MHYLLFYEAVRLRAVADAVPLAPSPHARGPWREASWCWAALSRPDRRRGASVPRRLARRAEEFANTIPTSLNGVVETLACREWTTVVGAEAEVNPVL